MPDAATEVTTEVTMEVTTEVFNDKPGDNARLGGTQCASA
ncbi:MAG: hypothetical protein PWR02_120 [Synergistales bacterium]|nr:hypothetical protein [Synergistales bacterium]